MKISIAQIRNHMADTINRVAYGGERAILQRRGRGVAALVSMEDLQWLEEEEARQDKLDIEFARKARKEKGSITLEQLKEELGI